jgi:hypothetical protein
MGRGRDRGAQPQQKPAALAAELPGVRLISWRPISKGSLRGFVTTGLKLNDCPVTVASNGPWASLPSKAIPDGEGRRTSPTAKRNLRPFSSSAIASSAIVSLRQCLRWISQCIPMSSMVIRTNDRRT